jgi:hypothetical protein
VWIKLHGYEHDLYSPNIIKRIKPRRVIMVVYVMMLSGHVSSYQHFRAMHHVELQLKWDGPTWKKSAREQLGRSRSRWNGSINGKLKKKLRFSMWTGVIWVRTVSNSTLLCTWNKHLCSITMVKFLPSSGSDIASHSTPQSWLARLRQSKNLKCLLVFDNYGIIGY